jgi:Uma2 family endonuclease
VDYQQIESLEEYVLISQECQQVECRRRTSATTWGTVIYKAGDRVVLKSIGLEVSISELYRGLDS